ncbi:MAG: hypothetical protein HY678_01785 [Chloroflexi bacterium]|nr:hypothetical protein [Chloroflexota bacterium]
MAQSFTAGTSTDYGTFKWFEFSGSAPVSVTARYFWQDERVLRKLIRGGDESPPQVVLEPVLEFDDVVFTHTPTAWTYNDSTKLWSYTEGKITVTLLTTHDAGAEFPATTITATLISDLRPQIDLPAPIPGRLPPPTPPANQVGFRISGEPNLLQGTYRSGNGANLTFDDSSYYVTRGSGSPRTVTWEATSEVIDYTTITNISIEFVGRVDRSGISQSFFVYNPSDSEHNPISGYAGTPDESSAYLTANTDRTVTFEFNSSDVAYVNSLGSKVVKIKLMATDPAVFDHSADKLVFKVAGTPSSNFFRDFAVDTNPTIEVGSVVSGDFTGLASNDTTYYVTQETGDIIQWSAISEAITLDTATSTEVRFVGRTTKGSPTMQFYVFNPANGGDGYPATPNATTTYTSINSDIPTTFFLNSADLAYVNSLFPKEVRIRIKGSGGGAQWRFEADHLIFRVKP